jgi:excinuclease ABC subunit C
MLIDGGAVHASATRKVLEEAHVSLPVYGMVKDGRHRTRALVTPDGDEIGLSANPAVFALIGTIQEETHRFAVEYHRSLRSKNSFDSKLDEINGVGEKRRNNLIKSFGSLKSVEAATVEEISKVVPKNVAERIYAHFHEGSGGET